MSASSRKSLAGRAEKSLGTGCLRLFFLPFFLIGVGFIYGLTIHPLLKVARAQGWEKTPCVVDSSEVVTHADSDGATYSIKIVYHYFFADHRYTSDRYYFSTASSSGRKGKERVIERYPPGTETYCYVNPADAREAVIDRGPQWEHALGAFGLIFAVAGGWGLIYAPRLSGNQKRKAVVPRVDATAGGPTVLRPKHTPLARFFGMLTFSIVWNAFIGIFVFVVFFAEDAHRVPFFAKAIVGILALIGVGTIFGVLTNFLALFNPRLVITSSTTSVPLGGEFNFRWTVRGRTGMLRKLRITFEGREEATYKRGTSTSTDTQVFAEIPVFESSDTSFMTEGQGRVVVPANLMHTFEGSRNKVLWRLRVQGEIPRWPDVADEYPIVVLPLGLRS